jgi:5-methylcytosine-specific restriction endonuclease McrA
MRLHKQPVLLLNASYEPLRVISAKKALTLLTKGVAVVEVPTDHEIYRGIFVPSVLRLKFYRHVPIRLKVCSRKNIYARDGYCCQYCGEPQAGYDLTLDHILPKSRGGRNEWSNLVACCKDCNRRKADRTPEEANMHLLHRPMPQTVHTPRFLLRTLGRAFEAWAPYLWTDAEGDKRFVTIN